MCCKKNSPPAVSVLLPCYNASRTLPRALESLLNQTRADFEVVCVDDGSSDTTLEIIDRFAGRDNRVRAIPMSHGGIVAALNLGLAHCRAQLVARMDADDLALPRRLELQAVALEERPELDLVGCRVSFGGSRASSRGYALHVDWTNSLTSHADICLHRFVECPFPHPSIMFRRRSAERFGGYRDGPFPEDYELVLRWLDRGAATFKVKAELLVWNDPPDRLSRTDPRYDVQAFYRTKAMYLARWLKRHNPLHPEIHCIGAGRTARKRAALLEEFEIAVTAYVDIDPNKVGRLVQGRPVLHRTDLPPPGGVFCVSYVGSRGARDEIGRFLMQRGYVPGRDFIFAA